MEERISFNTIKQNKINRVNMDIIEQIKKEVINRSNKFQELTKDTKEEYNLYEQHIKYVYNNVIQLSKNKKVDLEIIKLSALLHDISMTDINLDRSKHNEYSATIAETLLKQNNYDNNKIQLIKKCILNHSSIRKEYRTTQEEQILVDADSLSHFDNYQSIYSFALNVMNLSKEESLQYLKDKLTKDYNEISKEVKSIIKDKYNYIMNLKEIN